MGPPAGGPAESRKRSEFRRRRVEAGFSQESLAQAISASTASVRAWESGAREPTPRYRGALAEALGLSRGELNLLLDPLALQPMPTDGLSPAMAQLNLFIRSEQVATELRCVDLSALPALTQTERYAYHVERASHRQPTEDEVRRTVELRLGRHLILDRAEPPKVHLLIAAWLLDTEPVDREQIERLLELHKRPNIDLRIIDGRHLLPVGASFTLVTPPGNREPTLVAEFNLLGPAYDESGLAIADFSSLFGTLRALARGVDETADYLAARLRDRGRNRA